MSGLRRRAEETWLEFRMRGLRAARQILRNAGSERWSTMWLRRHWQYRGLVAAPAGVAGWGEAPRGLLPPPEQRRNSLEPSGGGQ